MPRPRFFLLINRAQRAIKTRAERETLDAIGLTTLELVALWALSAEPRLGIQALAKALHVDHAVISRLSKQLVRKGMTRRVSDPDDGRKTLLEITDLGATKADEGHRILHLANERIARGFTDDELAIVARFLEQLIEVGHESGPLEVS
ncbi:MAG: MarR family transcriptional regulator [Acidobacteriota bacterium]